MTDMSEAWSSINPATGEAVWRGQDGDVDAAVVASRAALPEWLSRSQEERVAVAERFRDVVRIREEEFARLIATETGKVFWESKTEVASVAAKADISIVAQRERAGQRVEDSSGVRRAVRHKPHGVVAVLGPYNFPAHLPNGHITPALLAGNVVVFKPSEQAPAVGEFLVRCWQDAGLPAGALVVVHGRADVGRRLSQHAGIDGLFFTGSAATGRRLHESFASTPQRILALETGGNNPLIAWQVAPEHARAAAGQIVMSAFISAGQRCTCARRLIVAEDDRTTVDEVVALADRIRVGGAFDEPPPFIGPVVSNAAAERVERAYRDLVSRGGRVILALTRVRAGLPFLGPAMIDVTGLDVPDEEIFGPVLQVVRVSDFASALATANATRFGLAAGLIGGDRALYERFWAASRAGVVNWNRPTTGASSASPFGGVGISGNHRPSAFYAADYCAWPVSSLEAREPAMPALIGLSE